jgi:hypothetical protein
MTNILIFDLRSATTMTTTVTMMMTTMTARPLLYITTKGCFENFKYEKQGETLEIFFFVHSPHP